MHNVNHSSVPVELDRDAPYFDKDEEGRGFMVVPELDDEGKTRIMKIFLNDRTMTRLRSELARLI